MQTLSHHVFKLGPPGGLFDDSVIRSLFPGAGDGARRLLLHRALVHGEVLRLKRGLYCLAPEYRKSHPHPFVVAAALHSPSQISLETALAFHGLIPEAVYQVSSVTVQRSRSFTTPLGSFIFYRVPCHRPRAGVQAQELGRDAWAFVASPLRAIADLVYLRKEISWTRDGLRFLTDSMRIEEDDLRAMNLKCLDEIRVSFRNQRTREYLAGLQQELRR